MANMVEQSVVDARRAADPGPLDGLVERLADRVGAKATVRVVFGEAIQRGEVTVVPVARVRWGFGGGAGRSEEAPTRPASGAGGGGGVTAEPAGYLEIRDAGATFRPITPPYPSAAFLLAAGVASAFIIRALARLAGR